MVFVGIDPSFSETGVCILDTESKTIKFIAVKPPGKNNSYKDILDRSAYVSLIILENIFIGKDVLVVIEEPLINSMKASSLGILSGVIVTSLVTMPFVTNIYSMPTSYVSKLNREVIKSQDLGRKQASKVIAENVIKLFVENKEYAIDIVSSKYNRDGSKKQRALSHDEAEALLLLTQLLKMYKILSDNDIAKLSLVSKKIGAYQNVNVIKGRSIV